MRSLTAKTGFGFRGMCASLMRAYTENWMLTAPQGNPAMLDMFRERDKKPYRDLLPWSGEFVGKYLTGAWYLYKATGDMRLKETALGVLYQLLDCIDDGYLGCFSRECRLTGAFSQTPDVSGATWDAWGHYHAMYAMYLWHVETGDKKIFSALEEVAGLFLRIFYGKGQKRLVEIGSTEMNLSVLHAFALLHKKTGRPEYLTFIRRMVEDTQMPGAGDYVRSIEAGLEFYQCAKPRWESLHIIMGLLDAADCLQEPRYEKAAYAIFDSILKTDVHNTGGFSTREQAVGNPFEPGAIELCCVIAYNALATQIFLRTGRADIARFLEISYYNAIMGSYSPSGRWSTYDTPMDGAKKSNCQDIVFQARPGSPELNCCSANSGRGLGQLSAWAFTREEDRIYINFFEDCDFVSDDGVRVTISGGYPTNNCVHISVQAEEALRVFVRMEDAYREIGRDADVMFDHNPKCLAGGGIYEGKACVYVGPILFGADLRDNNGPLEELKLERQALSGAEMCAMPDGRRVLKMDGLRLTDFYHLGSSGSAYRTWL